MGHEHDDDTVTTYEAAQLLHTKPANVNRRLRAGQFPEAYKCQECAPTQPGGAWRIPRRYFTPDYEDVPLFDF